VFDCRSEYRRLKAAHAEVEGLRDRLASMEIRGKAKDQALEARREAAERQVNW
jgi:hypothetical protein